MNARHRKPTVSCITALGRPEFDYLALASASLTGIADHYRLEWVVACDGLDVDLVTDATWEFPIRPVIVASPETGMTSAGEARSRALRAATGDLMLTLDSDDVFHAQPMVDLIDLAVAGGYAYAAGLADDINPDGSFRAHPPYSAMETGPVPLGAYFEHWETTTHWPWHPSATVTRVDLVRSVGGWPGRGPLRDDEDTFLWATLNRTLPGYFSRDIVMSYRVHDASVTKQTDYASGNRDAYLAAWAGLDMAAAA